MGCCCCCSMRLKKRLLDFECNLNASKGCNSLWLQQKKGRKKIICKCKNRDCPHLFFFPSSSSFPLSATLSRPPPPSAESHYRNTISNTSAQVFDRLQTNLYSGGKQKAAEIYLECGGEKQASAWTLSNLRADMKMDQCTMQMHGEKGYIALSHSAHRCL